ncbi:MAG: alpha/beta hydrolase, partial [Kineosporiaceae bacterium]
PSDSRGVLVIATGGPGSSGIAEADQRLATMSTDITDHYDVVFFDQRGVGLSQPFSCDDSLYDDSPPPLTTTSGGADRDAFARAARQFATDCFDEAGVDPADAWQYSTRQAAEDLEAFRQWLGVDRMILYGESYGTEFQQTYAAAHPDHVEELILDGVVDQTTDALPFALERVRTQSAVLGTTLTACDADAVCAADAPGKSLAGYDELARALRAAPRYYRYPLATGGTERRELTIDDLQTAAGGSISVRSTRLQLQRAVNAALQGDDVPLARLAAAASGADPDTGDVAFDPGFSEALFFAVECQDYDFVPAGSSGRRELDRWLDAGRAAGVDGYRLGGVFYSDLPCLFWPTGGEHAQRPEPTTKTPYPVLLLTADTDPNTPTADALRLARRMQPGAALVSLQGGPHVIYGRGERCVDDLVSTTIVSGRLPALPVTVCPGPVADPYAPIPPRQAAAYSDPRGTVGVILSAVLDEPTYSNWPGDEPLTLGCEAGGTVRYDLGTKDVVTATLDHCAWTADVPVTGTVEVQDAGTGDATLSVTLPFAMLTMQADGRLGGSFRGRPVR